MTENVQRIALFIRETVSSLPSDVETALRNALNREFIESCARAVLNTILENVNEARKGGIPLCQDTGTLTFFVHSGLREVLSEATISEAVAYATAQGWLRRNTFDSITGKSIDTNVCDGAPVIHWTERVAPQSITLLMKGGGSENMSVQFSLPDLKLGAQRDLEGIRKCILSAVQQAQGFGCAPGILGVCVGGDRTESFAEAKYQLLRKLDDVNPNPVLAELETRVLEEANQLGIGPMGLGGKTTLLGVKIGSRPRLPASYFVTIAYMCWAARRQTMIW